MVTVITGNIYLSLKTNVQWMESGLKVSCRRYDVFDIFTDWHACSSFRMLCWKLPPHLYQMLLVTLTHIGRGESIVYVCVVICWHSMCWSVNVCCVCVILCCVLIHTLHTHDVRTHICCKMTVQSILMTLHFNTFLTLCCTSQICVARVTSTVPSRYTMCGYCVWKFIQYKSSDICVDVVNTS